MEMNFRKFEEAVRARFKEMIDNASNYPLFKMAVDKDDLWQIYLNSFPEGSNPLYKERTEHDCNGCKSFIKAVGSVVSVKNGQVISIWDVNIAGPYGEVAKAMAAFVKQHYIENVFLHAEPTAGRLPNHVYEDGRAVEYRHFFVQIPRPFLKAGKDIGTALSDTASTHGLFKRGLETITDSAIETVLELISQGSLYRGEEHLHTLKEFKKAKDKMPHDDYLAQLYVWEQTVGLSPAITRVRNTSIGTLLVDLSEGMELEEAVKLFETKVAPANYKRPTALVTPAMIKKAKETLVELGLEGAIHRRHAHLEDVSINNVLFADRSARAVMKDVFDEMAEESGKPDKLGKVEEISIEKFISDVLPSITSMEVCLSNSHINNLVSLIAPEQPGPSMFKWDNNFSWSYNGNFADSIKERVKAAGGSVTGFFRTSLSWSNYDDLDLHMIEADKHEIFFRNKRQVSMCGGMLDVDMNAGGGGVRNPVENITYASRPKVIGKYTIKVHQYHKMETKDVGFEVEVEIGGEVFNLAYDRAVRQKEIIHVADVTFNKDGSFKFEPKIESKDASKEVWGIHTNRFVPVNVVMLSPNYWDDRAVGNKHYFFMLQGCQNDSETRGFYNEFLRQDLDKHRKVLEIVGNKMTAQADENQLSGVGFSSTNRNKLLCRVSGNFTRNLLINF